MAAANAKANDGPADQVTPERQPNLAQPTAVELSPPTYAENEALCSYMARDVVRGRLTPDGGTPIPEECKATIAAAEKLKAWQRANHPRVFTMSDVDTDREIKRLLNTSLGDIKTK